MRCDRGPPSPLDEPAVERTGKVRNLEAWFGGDTAPQTISNMNWQAPDLRVHPPRSPRVRLGGYVILARMLDKGRALLAGTNGEYNYNCPLDQQFLSFTGLDAEALKAELAAGKSDGEILAWVQAHARPHSMPEILAWSAWQEQRTPDNPDSRAFLNELHRKLAPHRTDIVTWFDLLDLDDYVSFGGRP